MKLAIGQFSHETNTFSKTTTTLDVFSSGSDIILRYKGSKTPIGSFIDITQEQGIDLIPTMVVGGTGASGLIKKSNYETLRDDMVNAIKKNDVDGVLLSLHGAMVVDGIADGTGDLLRTIRENVGDNVPIVGTLDPHGNMTEQMVENSDALFGLKTIPHIDGYERGVDACRTIIKILKGEIKPTMVLKKPRMLVPGIIPSYRNPMLVLCQLAELMQRKKNALYVSVYQGFNRSDVPDAGMSIIAITNKDTNLADDIATMLNNLTMSLKEEFVQHLTPIDEAVDRVVKASKGLLVLADIGDAPGGGGSGDGTVILNALLDKGARNVAVGSIRDPEVVKQAIDVGVGKKITTELGSKTDDFAGKPLHISGKVRSISDGTYISTRTGLVSSMGRTVVLLVDSIEILVTEKKSNGFPETFRSVGTEPLDRKAVVVKSNIHYRAPYEPIAKEIIEVDSPGLAIQDACRLDELHGYKNVRRPIFPLDKN